MSEKIERFAKQLKELVIQGDHLLNAMQYKCLPREFIKECTKKLGGDTAETKKFLDALPNFRTGYQKWYSEAQAVVRQLLPGRLEDFNSYYEYPKMRKDITSQNYMIKDSLQGLQIKKYSEIVADSSSAIPAFTQQLHIVRAALTSLDSVLMDLKGILQAELYDTEVESAGALAKAGYLRAAGAICGVIIEKHLQNVCGIHCLKQPKKNPTINDLNQLLKDNSILNVPQWRHIQLLADIRNLCDHAKDREPTKEEIADLVTGTEKILKTIF